MAVLIGKGHIHGLGTGAWASADLTISPNLQTLRISHGAELDRIRDQLGDTTALIFSDEMLEITIDAIPEGTTIANSKTSAKLPAPGSTISMTGFPIIDMGAFADCLNTDGATSSKWIYEGGGSINGSATEKWTMTLPLKRYASAAMSNPAIIS